MFGSSLFFILTASSVFCKNICFLRKNNKAIVLAVDLCYYELIFSCALAANNNRQGRKIE